MSIQVTHVNPKTSLEKLTISQNEFSPRPKLRNLKNRIKTYSELITYWQISLSFTQVILHTHTHTHPYPEYRNHIMHLQIIISTYYKTTLPTSLYSIHFINDPWTNSASNTTGYRYAAARVRILVLACDRLLFSSLWFWVRIARGRDMPRQGGGGGVARNITKTARSFSKVPALRLMCRLHSTRVSTSTCIHMIVCVLECVGTTRNRHSRITLYRQPSKSWQQHSQHENAKRQSAADKILRR